MSRDFVFFVVIDFCDRLVRALTANFVIVARSDLGVILVGLGKAEMMSWQIAGLMLPLFSGMLEDDAECIIVVLV